MNTILIFTTLFICLEISLIQGIDLKSLRASDTKAKLAKADLLKAPQPETTETIDVFATDSPELNNATQDHHVYYNSTFYSNSNDAKRFWVNFENLPEHKVVILHKLSNAYRQATTIELPFEFPFYGHSLKNVTIATGGFIYVGDYVHNWLAATQYIAPLMANFDTRLSPESQIKYADDGTSFTVMWEKIYVQGRSENSFSFQTTLYKSGDIVFAYKDVPYPITNISDSQHPVKIGISDAYVMERTSYFIRRKTVYEYHRIAIEWPIASNTALYFTALPTCVGFKTCSSCVSAAASMECSWCSAIQRCSNGADDRQMQSWLANGCSIRKETTCPVNETSTTAKAETEIHTEIPVTKTEAKSSIKYQTSSNTSPYQVNTLPSSDDGNDQKAAPLMHDEVPVSETSVSAGAIATIVLFIVAIMAAVAWVFYAYKYPQSSSGQFLIKYRPSQWTVRKDDNTPATSNTRHF